jgi:hypothetical protein
VQADIAIERLTRNTLHKIIPGQIDAGLIHMAHKRAGIEPVMVVIPEDEDIIEIIEFEFFQAKRQLDGSGAHQDGHFCNGLDFDIMKILGLLELIGTKKEFPLLVQTQSVIIFEMTGNNRMIKGLARDEFLKLLPCI